MAHYAEWYGVGTARSVLLRKPVQFYLLRTMLVDKTETEIYKEMQRDTQRDRDRDSETHTERQRE